jgi:pyridoxal-phosphate dependent enzyme
MSITPDNVARVGDVDRTSVAGRAWVHEAVRRVEADGNRSAGTHLVRVPLARLLGLPFVAVMPRSTSREKIALIEREGGRCHLVSDPTAVYDEAIRLAEATGGHYMDQFTFAERATDWRGNNNIAESIIEQMSLERFPVPRWIVVGAGTGGTSATISRSASRLMRRGAPPVAMPSYASAVHATLQPKCQRPRRCSSWLYPRHAGAEPSREAGLGALTVTLPDVPSACVLGLEIS